MICAKSIVKGAIEHRHCPICRAGIERVLNVGHKAIRWDSKDFIQCEDGVGECVYFSVQCCLTHPVVFLLSTQTYRCCYYSTNSHQLCAIDLNGVLGLFFLFCKKYICYFFYTWVVEVSTSSCHMLCSETLQNKGCPCQLFMTLTSHFDCIDGYMSSLLKWAEQLWYYELIECNGITTTLLVSFPQTLKAMQHNLPWCANLHATQKLVDICPLIPRKLQDLTFILVLYDGTIA